MVSSVASEVCQLYGGYATSMPTRSLPPSPKELAVSDLASVAPESLVSVDGPHAVRTVMPPMDRAVRPESLRKSRRE